MSLISCPECSKDVSDKVKTCPHCGFPFVEDSISKETVQPQKVEVTGVKLSNTNFKRYAIIVISAVVVVLIAFFMIKIINEQKAPTSNLSEIAITDLDTNATVGVGVILDYADDNVIVFHGYFGLFAYDLKKQEMMFTVDFLKTVGINYIQASEGVAVIVSDDGKTVMFYHYDTEQGEPEKAYYIDTSELTCFYGDYKPMVGVFQIDSAEGAIIGDEIGTLRYIRGDRQWQLFSDLGEFLNGTQKAE